MKSTPATLRILPPPERLEDLFDAEARLMTALSAAFPGHDFVLAQSPRPPGARLMVVPATDSTRVPEADLRAAESLISEFLDRLR